MNWPETPTHTHRAAAAAPRPGWPELIWRDFYPQLMAHFPHVVERSFKPAYDAIEWETGEAADALFSSWITGRTGYPLVDAAMVQLNQTGYMNNRLRMVVASFLVKDLGLNWRRGEAYFAAIERLRASFQQRRLAVGKLEWLRAQPWFGIFNPLTQSCKFDPQGRFIRRYLHELAQLDDAQLHAPRLAGPDTLRAAAVVMGETYPRPVVEHGEARARTLARDAIVKEAAA